MEFAQLKVGPGRTDVYYRRAGQGEPLLYLHHVLGLAGSGPALTALESSFDAIAPCAPGWGPAKDQLPDFDEGPLDLVLHFNDLLDALEVEAAHVLGIGIGAWMGAELAAISPARVRRLMLVNPMGLWLDEAGGEDPFAQHPGFPSNVLFADGDGRKTHLFDGRDKMDAHVEELLSLRAGAKFLWPIPDTGVSRRLPRIKAQTLVVTSDKDVVVPAAYGPAWQQAIDGAGLEILADAGHAADCEQPQALARLAAAFLGDGNIAAVA